MKKKEKSLCIFHDQVEDSCFLEHSKKLTPIAHSPAARVLVQVGAGKALVFTTHFEQFPGLLSILNVNPIEI